MENIIVIGIAGGSGSGKTTITEAILDRLGDDITVIKHDSYYKAHHSLPYEERVLLNYDHPESYDTELLIKDLAALKRGEEIQCPVYDFTIHDRSDVTVTIKPSRVIVVEGILIFCDETLRNLMDIKVFVDTDADVRIVRRITRDMNERGRSLESIVTQYLATVKPMHELFVEPSKKYADIIIPEGGENLVALEMLLGRIQMHLENND